MLVHVERAEFEGYDICILNDRNRYCSSRSIMIIIINIYIYIFYNCIYRHEGSFSQDFDLLVVQNDILRLLR